MPSSYWFQLPLVIAPFLEEAPYLTAFKQLRGRSKRKLPERSVSENKQPKLVLIPEKHFGVVMLLRYTGHSSYFSFTLKQNVFSLLKVPSSVSLKSHMFLKHLNALLPG